MAMRVESKKESIGIDNDRVFGLVNSAFGESMHLKRVESLANAALGLLHSKKLCEKMENRRVQVKDTASSR